jgi:pimeloyl-ACP methyl ester carboxylesterase
MTKPKLQYSKFTNGVPLARFGSGSKTLLFPVGGPGNLLPTARAASGFIRIMQGFTTDYTVYLASRKSGLREGYTTRDMADDYAELIRQDFGGHIHLALGHSFGGLILQHLAAEYPKLVDHVVICGAAHRITDAAKSIDLRYAQLINQGNDRNAMAVRAEAVFPRGPLKHLLYGVLWLFAKQLLGPIDATFRRDVLIEAQAEVNHESIESLKRINLPVLIICGRHDFAFRLADVEEMAGLIRGSRLKVYDRSHAGLIMDRRLVGDVRAFTTMEGK